MGDWMGVKVGVTGGLRDEGVLARRAGEQPGVANRWPYHLECQPVSGAGGTAVGQLRVAWCEATGALVAVADMQDPEGAPPWWREPNAGFNVGSPEPKP